MVGWQDIGLELCASVVLITVGVSLSGCSSTPSTDATTTSTITSTTTWTTGIQTPPLTLEQAVDYMNEHYMGFNEKRPDSPLGLTVNFRPGGEQGKLPIYVGSCYEGHAPNMTSTTLYNHKIVISNETGGLEPGLKRSVGIVYNQSGVETHFGKCVYMWDGASENRLHSGCGCGATGAIDQPGSCDDHTTAYWNIDPKTGEWANSTSPSVKDCGCMTGLQPMPVSTLEPACYFRMPAFTDIPDPGLNHLRSMVEHRLANQHGSDPTPLGPRPRLGYWNELVLDNNQLLEALWKDPVSGIMGIFFVSDGDPEKTQIAQQDAQQYADWIKDTYHLGGVLPVIMLDTQVNVSKRGAKPFKLPPDFDTIVY